MDTRTTTTDTTRFRELGQARLDAMAQVQSQKDWERLWKKPEHEYPFAWGTCWKQCTQYCVEDFAAEVGFWVDVMNLPTNALAPGYAMFTSPDKAFYFSIVPADDKNSATLGNSLNLGFMIQDLPKVAEELEKRGVVFTKNPQAWEGGGPLLQASFATPNGIEVQLWCMPEQPADEDS